MAGNRRKTFPVHNAVEYKNLHKLKILLPTATTENINERDERGLTMLHYACDRTNNGEILGLLLTRDDLDLTVTNNDGFTVFHTLAYRDNLDGLAMLMEKFPNFDFDTLSNKENTVPTDTSKMGKAERVQYLLSKFKMIDKEDETFPLHNAVKYGKIDKLKILLPTATTKEINRKDEKGFAALHYACDRNNNGEILGLLLTREDLDLTVTDNDGFTVLHTLAYRDNLEGLVMVLETFPNFDINTSSNRENTVLIQACKVGNAEMVQYLLQKGAHVNHRNEKNNAALHYAANNGHSQCAELLIKYGADVNVRDDYQYTPLIRASRWGFLEVCEVLLKNGADVNAHAAIVTPLSFSCYNDSVDVTRLLIANRANIHYPGRFSCAVVVCASKGSVKCLRELIDAGVDVTATRHDGRHMLSFVKQHNREEIIRLLSPDG